MKNLAVGLVSALILLGCLIGYAEDDKKASGLNIGEGMEIRKIKGFNLLVPKDAATWYDGDVLKVEDVTEYSATRFIKINEQFKQIDKMLISLQKQVDELKKRLIVIEEVK